MVSPVHYAAKKNLHNQLRVLVEHIAQNGLDGSRKEETDRNKKIRKVSLSNYLNSTN